MNRSTFKKIIALTLIWGMLANICLLNAMQVLPAQADSIKNSPSRANSDLDAIPDDGATVDSSFIKLLYLSRSERFEIHLYDGRVYKGKIKIVKNGIKLLKNSHRKNKTLRNMIVNWSEINSVKILGDSSKFVVKILLFTLAGIFLGMSYYSFASS